MPRESREVWKKRLERWAESGLTASEFADEVGVNASTLAGWKWRLAAEARIATSAANAPARPSFVEVVAPLIASPAGEPSRVEPDPIELILSNGVRVRVPVGFDPVSLRRVVEALEHR